MLYTQNLDNVSPDMRGHYFKEVKRISQEINSNLKQKGYKEEVITLPTFSEAYDYSGELLTGLVMRLTDINYPKQAKSNLGKISQKNRFRDNQLSLKVGTTITKEDGKYIIYATYG